MKKFLQYLLFCLLSFSAATVIAQNLRFPDAIVVSRSSNTGLPNFVRLDPAVEIAPSEAGTWAVYAFHLPSGVSLRPYNSESDQLGFTHTRYREYVNEIPVEGSMLIAHSRNGRLETVNGDVFNEISSAMSVAVPEPVALKAALDKVNAKRYKWENKEETMEMAAALHQPDFSYFPKGELVVVHKDGASYDAASMRLAWKFNIYAELPLSRNYYFVDAVTGEVIATQQIIHTADVTGTANTKFSGTQTMTSDNYAAGQYRLRETGRGNGIQTYNLGTSTTYTNTDFTNTSSTWNITGTNQAATDAHWGAEKTYDYFQSVHSRNSIDNAGFALLSYVHYDVNYANAFWDGTRMTYGDGDISQGFLIMTALDVCGHEITHGLTSFTANLNGGGTGEADALNEGFSDIFGTTIEWYARPALHDWIIGGDITCNTSGVPDHLGIRNMSNPNAFAQPDTYLGTNWDATGEPHTNDGPSIFWYYLLCQGGSGTNDIGNAYNVTGITMNSARMIAFRGLTNYFTPSTTYADARTYTIQSALDLYGACSPEVIATTNAWYAVGVGAQFSATVSAAFAANITNSCVLPADITFTNTSTNATSATWYFGDGGTSTAINPTHTYTAAGTYNVKLIVSSSCGTDSILQSSYITVNPPAAPATTDAFSCTSPSSVTLSATGGGTLKWYTASTGGSSVYSGTSYTTPSLSSTTTYYVESQTPGTSGYVGPTTTSFGTGGLHNNTSTQYLTFDMLQSCTIQTVLVNSGAAGTRNVILYDNAGAVLQTLPIAFPLGTGTVTLNVHLTPGSYRIGGTMMNLYRNNSGPVFPYTLTGSITITGSSAGSGYYYYFYNWHVVNDPCVSARTAVTASIGGPSVTYSSAPYDTMCVTASAITLTGGAPAGGVYSGPGVSSGNFDPSVSGSGNQSVMYAYTDINGCTGSMSQNIYVDPCVATGMSNSAAASGMSIYPNPTAGEFVVEVGMTRNERVLISITDAVGQMISREEHELIAGNNKFSVDLSGIATGIYFIKMTSSSGMMVKRITKS